MNCFFFAGVEMGDGLSQLYLIKLQYRVIHYPDKHTLLLSNSCHPWVYSPSK